MPRPIPLASAVAAATGKIGTPPIVVWVHATRPQNDNAGLLNGCVELSLGPHPAVVTAMTRLGLSGHKGFVSANQVAALIAAVSPGTIALKAASGNWRTARTGSELCEALNLRTVLELPKGVRPQAARGTWVRLSLQGKRIHYNFVADNFLLAGRKLLCGERVRLGVDEAVGVLETLDSRLVVDGSQGAFSALVRLATSSRTAFPVPGAPGMAMLRDALAAPTYVTASAAVLALAEVDGTMPVACHSDVADMAAITAANPATSDFRLRSHQQHAVGAYMSSRWGLVCALPPGSGKTVVAAAALAERHKRGATRSIIVVPGALKDQWCREIATYCPNATIVRCDCGTDIQPTASPEHHIWVVPYELVAQETSRLQTIGADDLIVDEATFITRPSKRTKALKELRRTIPKTMLLSGTPHEKGVDDIGVLAEFVLNRDVFSLSPLSKPHIANWRDRVGPILFGINNSAALDELPTLKRRVVSVSATREEQAVLAAAASELDATRATLSAATTNVERRRARLMVTNAATELRAITADVAAASTSTIKRLATLVGANGTKRAWLRAQLSDRIPTVICVASAAAADAITADLLANGVKTVAFTSSTPQNARSKAALTLGSTIDVVVVATSSHQGWDLPSAKRVIHIDVPTTVSEELQRSSRARRMSSDAPAIDVIFVVFDTSAEHRAATALITALGTI